MKRKTTRYSLSHFFHFLETVWQEKLIKKNDLKQWQEAVTEFQKVMNAEEIRDLRRVEIKRLSNRYIDFLVDSRSSITPWRIYQLKNGLAAAIGNFIAFTINPNEYRRGARLAMAKQIYIKKKAHVAAAAILPLPIGRHSEPRLSSGAP